MTEKQYLTDLAKILQQEIDKAIIEQMLSMTMRSYIKTSSGNYLIYNQDIIDWVNNLDPAEYSLVFVDKDEGVIVREYKFTEETEVLFLLRWS